MAPAHHAPKAERLKQRLIHFWGRHAARFGAVTSGNGLQIKMPKLIMPALHEDHLR